MGKSQATPNKFSPTAMSPADLARLLTAAGERPVGAKEIAADVEAGAPTNPDGSINLVHYAAWLARDSDV